MATIRSDGSVLSSNTPGPEGNLTQVTNLLYKVQLTGINYVDQDTNETKDTQNPEVTYTGIVLNPETYGQIFENIRDGSNLFGGKDNFAEKIRPINTKPFEGKIGISSEKQDGSIVYVACMDGDISYPVIVADGTNQLSQVGSKKEDGPRWRWQYNGIYFEIDKNGGLKVINKGGELGQTSFETAEAGNEFSISLNKKILEVKTGKVILKIDGETGQVEIEAEKIKLGVGATESLVLGQKFMELFKAHTHMGNMGAPTGPMLNKNAPITPEDEKAVLSKDDKVTTE